MDDLLIIGSFARDQIRVDRRRWTQPGGAAWHGGLSMAESGVRILGQAGPWAQAFAVPAIRAARRVESGVWLGPATDQETTFVNDYGVDRRYQRLRSAARPIHVSDLRTAAELVAISLGELSSGGVVVSPLYPRAVDAPVVAALVEAGAFVGVDAQGSLRRVGERGVVETGSGDVEAWSAGAVVLKFSEREFRVAYPNDDVEREALRVAERTSAEILVTAGDRGALLVGPDGSTSNTYDRVPGVVRVDSTGAGDVLLARYVAGRVRGLERGEALEDAVDEVSSLLEARAVLGKEEDTETMHLLRGLQALATWAWWRLAAGRKIVPGDEALFAPDGRLGRMVAATLPGRALVGDEDLGAGSRGPALLGVLWALRTLGRSAEFGGAAVLRGILQEEGAAASRVREALLA